jgi:hypothetical protein
MLEHVRGEQELVAGPVERRDERERCEGERKHDQRHPPAFRVARTSVASQTQESTNKKGERDSRGYDRQGRQIPGCPAHNITP